MKLSLNKLKLKQDIDRFEVLHWGVFFFLLLGALYQCVSHGGWFLFLIQVCFFTFFFFFLRKLLRDLYYSFWTFTGLLAIFLVFKIVRVDFWEFSFFSYLTSLSLLATEAYLLWTPIFYPMISWWEYDFRYRNDLKVKAIVDAQEIEGRLTDLRKGAGCISLFKELKVGEYVHIELEDGKSFKVEIMSKRYYSLGRPLSYGVRFELVEESEKQEFRLFSKFWRNSRKQKRKEKFSPA